VPPDVVSLHQFVSSAFQAVPPLLLRTGGTLWSKMFRSRKVPAAQVLHGPSGRIVCPDCIPHLMQRDSYQSFPWHEPVWAELLDAGLAASVNLPANKGIPASATAI
jgi:hypothetical protein